MIDVDIDLDVTGPGGSISINQLDSKAIQLNMSGSAILRESIRNYGRMESLLRSKLGSALMDDYTFLIQINSQTVAHLKRGKILKGRKFYLLLQYLFAKLGF
ncbi:MAG: hypothetical protein ACNS64_04160 [Candidatus Halalkalibacterium sp. M3_1C_030]